MAEKRFRCNYDALYEALSDPNRFTGVMPGGEHPVTADSENPWTGQSYESGRIRVIPVILSIMASHENFRDGYIPLILAQDQNLRASFNIFFKPTFDTDSEDIFNPYPNT